MSSLLTLEQVRYAYVTRMGTRALHHFCNIDDPDSVQVERSDRRWARQYCARERARFSFNRTYSPKVRLRRFLDMSDPTSAGLTLHISIAGHGVDGRSMPSLRVSL